MHQGIGGMARKSGIWVGNDLWKAKNIQTRIMETGEFQRNNGDRVLIF